jgi:hypothetical protein
MREGRLVEGAREEVEDLEKGCLLFLPRTPTFLLC